MAATHSQTAGSSSRRGTPRSLRGAGFEEERCRLAEAEALLGRQATQAELREGLERITGHYSSLLAHTAKLTRIGDANQARLMRLQEAREAAERRYRSIFESALEGLFRVDRQGSFLDANPAFLSMFGFADLAELKSATQQAIRSLFVEPTHFDAVAERALAGETIRDDTFQATRTDGSIFWAAQSLEAVADEETETQVLQGAMVDVSVRREAEEALRRATRTAEEANRAKSNFLAKVTHELRTPLNGILGYTQVLKRQLEASSRVRESLDCIRDSADHLLTLIEDLLDHSRLETHHLELNLEDFAVADFFRSIENQFKLRATTAGLRYEQEIDERLPEFWRCDPGKLRQVLFNLLGNALKFTEKGSVVLRVHPERGDWVTFAVEDTGPGISGEDLERIFRPFEQARGQSGGGGAGLGLAISRNLVELMGGELSVRSETGVGSCFCFSLPLPAPDPESASNAWRITGYQGPRLNLMLISASAADWAPFRRSLREWGFDLTEQNHFDGSRCVADQLSAELVLAWLKPEAGIDAALVEQYLADCQDIPVILVAPPGALDTGAFSFANGCLTPPLTPETLSREISRVLRLQWHYEEGEPLAGDGAEVSRPPNAVLAELRGLVDTGRFAVLRRRLEAIGKEAPELVPFVREALAKAAEYRSDALRAFFEASNPGEVGG
ncbi:MAG: PAS domain-containing sensor histidine kinase [Opitutales bacterium]